MAVFQPMTITQVMAFPALPTQVAVAVRHPKRQAVRTQAAQVVQELLSCVTHKSTQPQR
jgi:hypothetical protein